MKAWERLSLRTRLGSLYAALLIFSVVLLGCCSYWNVWQLFISNKSSHLRARAKPVIEHWLLANSVSGPDSCCPKLDSRSALILARDLTSRDASAIILNKMGEVIAGGRRLPEEPEPPAPDKHYIQRALAGENDVTYLSRMKSGPVLVLLIPLRPEPASPRIFGVIQMSSPLTDINTILFRHGSMLIALTAIILILGTGAGFWLIGVSLKDLQALLAACNQISRGNFSKRVPVRNSRDEIGRLAASFNQMAGRIEDAFSSQQRFVANAAHELLTPLTGLRGSLEVLLRGAQDDPGTAARLSRGMYKEVNRMIRLCEQLLGLSRLESSSNIRKEPVVLPEFFQDFKSQAQVLARSRPLVIQQGPRVKVWADPDLLKQVLLNLLSNALRYSPPEMPVIISWKLLPEQVEIRVSDQGQGMDAETMSHVFEPFYQGKSTGISGEKGIGLGLCLAKSMVEAHQGTIRIRSEPGRGTTVYFTLPLE